jgi:hypothetical protein
MNEFRTPVRDTPSNQKISLKNPILTLGSCFSDAMGSRLAMNKFSVKVNPYGVIFNPISIHRLLTYSISKTAPESDSYVQNDDLFLNFHLHSSFSGLEKNVLQEKINQRIQEVHDQLKYCKWILITYGTAWVYTIKTSGLLVANCHKQPSHVFDKSLLTTEHIIQSFEDIYRELKTFNPSVRIILTVSPVRHIKDTLPLNSVSKSVLRVACHLASKNFDDVEYFPAYEMMMDDLRDYRFYKSDMIHPTEQAEDYIWNGFAEKYMDAKTLDFIQQWKTIYPSLQHRPFHPESSRHQIFLRQLLHKLEQLKDTIDVKAEMHSIQAQLLDSNNPKKTPL